MTTGVVLSISTISQTLNNYNYYNYQSSQQNPTYFLNSAVCCTAITTYYLVGINFGSAAITNNMIGQFYAVRIA